MAAMLATARAFFEACEAGQGWDACAPFCTPDAGFAAQADGLGKVTTVARYAEWMKRQLPVLPDMHYEDAAFAVDEAGRVVMAFATFVATHLAGGPVPPTGRTTRSHYVYVMRFREGRIAHITKVWNSAYALKELGWA